MDEMNYNVLGSWSIGSSQIHQYWNKKSIYNQKQSITTLSSQGGHTHAQVEKNMVAKSNTLWVHQI